MSGIVERLLQEQRGRLVASIMQHAEREIYPKLTVQQQVAFRRKVLESVGVFYDFCRDALRASSAVSESEGVAINEEAMRLLGEIHRQVMPDGPG